MLNLELKVCSIRRLKSGAICIFDARADSKVRRLFPEQWKRNSFLLGGKSGQRAERNRSCWSHVPMLTSAHSKSNMQPFHIIQTNQLLLSWLFSNKIGHGLHDLDGVFQSVSYEGRIGSICRELGLEKPLVVQSMYIFKQARIGDTYLHIQYSWTHLQI